ncbi:unnamed protein product [Adineta ricciae]|uniref:Uncharacterized protein n=1 Tax=Adineta ricciae TaxID=249248 RepID=A0A814HMA3_ADIRI|nr:unnamed protein product [Adineta ricciae]CAF1484938.1 unnamed protein product [Adineta ricciae]
MVFRDRQGLSPQPSSDPVRSPNHRDRYLDNCFLLCINRDDDDVEIPEIRRLENNLMRELCNKTQSKSQQQSRSYLDDRNDEQIYDLKNDEYLNSRQEREYENIYRRRGYQQERDSSTRTDRSRYYRDDTIDNYQYPRPVKYQNDYHIMQHSDDELSVYEVYVPTNTLNRISDKRVDNNMVLIDYEDVSMMRDIKNGLAPYGHSPRNIPSHYSNYRPLNQYNDYSPQYQNPYDGQLQNYPTDNLSQAFPNYYGNERDRQPYAPQSGQFFPNNIPIDRSNAINVRRHIYSPSQLPQGLTEGQLVMLLQKGNQYQTDKSHPPTQNEPQPSSTTAITVSHKSSSAPNGHLEPFQNSEYVPSPQIKVPPQIIDHHLTTEEKKSFDESAKPMATLNPPHAAKASKDVESKESEEKKKKEKTHESKKDKKEEKDGGDHHKKDSKKEKSGGKESKKKKK